MHERIAVNTACFQRAGWDEVADAWRALAPRRVSAVGLLLDSDPEAARAVLSEGGYRLETVVQPFLMGHQLDAGEAVIAAERAKLARAIDFAASLGFRSLFIATGGRGSLSWEQAAEAFARIVAPCLEHAARAGLILMIENTPPLYADLHICHSLRDTVTLAEMSGLTVCIDVFSCWTEAGLEQTIARAMPNCDLIQVADYVYGDRALPARAVPGDGAVPLRRIFDWALSAGFAGAFDLEMMGPRIDAEGHLAAVRRAADAVGEILVSLGA